MADEPEAGYDAVVVVSFGGPEGMDDIKPFLDRVLRGRPVPSERLEEVATRYRRFGGVSPLNAHNRALVAALQRELDARGLALPVYWGNRNWHPLLPATVERMRADGVRRALAFVTSAYASYSGCRQYLEDLARARAEVGPGAPTIDKLRLFFNHPGFVETNADNLLLALVQIGTVAPLAVAFTAHSLPAAQAATCAYEAQLEETARLVMARAGGRGRHDIPWRVVYQSRSGPPDQPWLEPDVGEHVRSLARDGVAGVVVAPIGFTSDHMEVVYDLDVEARRIAEDAGLSMVRAATAGTAPRFVTMIRELVEERLQGTERRAAGRLEPWPDDCPAGCCPPPASRVGP